MEPPNVIKFSDVRYHYAERLKILTFFGIVISIISATSTVIIIPLVYSYIQRVHSSLYPDLEICRGETDRLWRELLAIEEIFPGKINNRRPRHAVMDRYSVPYSSQYVVNNVPRGGYAHSNAYATAPPSYQQPPRYAVPPTTNAVLSGRQCCGCSLGEPGLPGLPGVPGEPGIDGQPGEDGQSGVDASPGVSANDQWCFDCPQAPAGPPGKIGTKGAPGPPGQHGRDGQNGRPGNHGLVGDQGPSGSAGPPGPNGPLGPIGKVLTQQGKPGPPGKIGIKGQIGSPGSSGPPGNDGAPGNSGPPGDAGHIGLPGQIGAPGQIGELGSMGTKGLCDHCSPPRLEAGYHS